MKDRLGNLSKTGLPALLHLIYEKGDASGILDVINEPAKKRFFFKNGMPVAASSNVLSEVLGRLLMAERIISQKDYETSLEVVLRDKRKHGEVLISMGLITSAELERFLALQLKKRLWKVFGWKQGEYKYIKAEALPPGIDRQQPLHPAPLILEGITLGFYPPARAKEDLGKYLDSPFKFEETAGKLRPDDFRVNLQEKRFLESFDGSRPLKEVLESSDLLRGRANALALSFIITGVMKPVAPLAEEKPALEEGVETAPAMTAGPERLNAELLFMKAKTALMEKDYGEAIAALKTITEISPAEGEYWAYLGWAIYNDDPSRIKEAEKIMKDALDLNAELDYAWHFLGKLSLASKNAELAERSFRTAVSKNPWSLESLAELKRIELKKSLGEGVALDARKKYTEAFGFLEDPFEAAPDLKYLDISPVRAKTLDAVINDIKKKSGPVLLEGVEGAGKSAFCLELLKRLSGEKVICAYLLKPEKREIRLMKAINHEFGCATDSASAKDELLSLGMRVSRNRTEGGHCIIIIDEADQLTPGGVKLVQYLARLKTLQLVLVAGPHFSDSLKAPEFLELDKKLERRYSLNPLTLEETKDYILKKLNGAKRAGQGSVFSLTGEALKLIFEESGGIPAEISNKSVLMLEKAARLGKMVLDIETAEPVSRKKEAFVGAPSEEAPRVKEPWPVAVKEGARPAAPVAEQSQKPVEETAKVPVAPVREKGPLLVEPIPEKARPERVSGPASPPEVFATVAPPVRREPERGLTTGQVEAHAEEKQVKIASKTRAVLLFILIIVAAVFAGSYIRVYLLGQGGAEKTPITTPGPLSPEAPKNITAPLTGSDLGEQPPPAGEKAKDRAAAISTTGKITGTVR